MYLASETKINRRMCEPEDDQPQSRKGMESLPSAVTLDILSRLPASSQIRSRFVSRAWQMLSHDPYLVELHFSRTTTSNPTLILHYHNINHFSRTSTRYPNVTVHYHNLDRSHLYYAEEVCDEQQGNQVVRQLDMPFSDAIPHFHIIGSCNGLLCISVSLYKVPLYILNPLTREYRELPNSREFEDQDLAFGFGFDPVSKEHKVVKLVYCCKGYDMISIHYAPRIIDWERSEVQVLTLGTNIWRVAGQPPPRLQIQRQTSPVLVSGRLHWLARPHPRGHGGSLRQSIVSFDLSDEQFQVLPTPPHVGHLRDGGDYYLVVLGGCLSLAVMDEWNHEILEIWVMKEYNVKESWMKEFVIRIGGHSGQAPSSARLDLPRSYEIRNPMMRERMAGIVCLQKNGNILVGYKDGTLVSYDPENRTSKIMFEGKPNLYQVFVHFGCLNSVDNPIRMNTN